jgi:hypothetical protein
LARAEIGVFAFAIGHNYWASLSGTLGIGFSPAGR